MSGYWSPIYAFLRRSGQSATNAADLTQGFLARLIEDPGLITKADADRGRFRSFLRASVKNFVIDEFRREHGRDGTRSRQFVPDDPAQLEAAEPSERDDPSRAFDRQWAATVLATVLQRLEADCRCEGLERHWLVFDARVLRDARLGTAPVAVEELIETVGARDRDEVYSMLNSMKRKFRQTMSEVIAETVDGSDEVDRELQELRQLLLAP